MDCGVDFTINHTKTKCLLKIWVWYGYENQTPRTWYHDKGNSTITRSIGTINYNINIKQHQQTK